MLKKYLQITNVLSWVRTLLLVLAALACQSIFALQVIDVSPDFRNLPAGIHAGYFLDKSKQIELVDILQLTDEQWDSPVSETPSYGFMDANLWLKLRIANPHPTDSRLALALAYPVLDHVELMVTETARPVFRYLTGDDYPFSQRPVNHRHFVFPITLTGNSSQTLYLKIHTSGTLQAPLQLWKYDLFFADQQSTLMLESLYYGIMLVMIIYNLFIFISVRHRSYLYYAISVASCTLYMAGMQGDAFQFIWPNHPVLNRYVVPLSIAMFGMGYMLFAASLLDIKQQAYRIYLAVMTFFFIWLALFVASLILPYGRIIKILALFGAISILWSAAVGIYMMYIGQRTARYYTLAWSCLMIGLLVVTANKLGLLPSHFLVEHAIQIGATLEVVLLSFALGDRINNERLSKQSALERALESDKRAVEERERYVTLKHKSELEEFQSREAIIRAQAESKAKSEFLATMSHEIRTPMNGVLGIATLLQDAELEPVHRQYVDIIVNSGKALLNVINDILDYSKIEAGKMEIENVDFDLDQLCLECASVFSVTAECKNIELICSLQPGTPQFINSDPTRLRQILLNLLGNAFKFTNKGQISLRVTEPPRGMDGNVHLLRFEISDTGVGMMAAVQARLFQAFSQGDSSITRQFGGTGLGLSICKKLTELMGGEIGVSSTPGKGSNFWFTIRCESAGRVFARENLVSLSALKGKKILIVDDSPDFVRVVQEQTTSWGMRSHAAYYGEEAIRMLKEATAAGDPFQLVSLDMNMPSMTGIECAQLISRAHDISPVLCVLLTAMRSIPKKSELQLYGIDIAIQKPASVRVLRQTIIDLVRGKTIDESDQSAPARSPLEGLKALVVEDNGVNQMVISGMLKKLGVHSELATNGAEAIRIYQDNPQRFDIVLMDCEMPVMDGFAACRTIREFEIDLQLARKPIYALTAHVMQNHQAKVIACGMDGHIVKPVEFSVLREKLLECLVFDERQRNMSSNRTAG